MLTRKSQWLVQSLEMAMANLIKGSPRSARSMSLRLSAVKRKELKEMREQALSGAM